MRAALILASAALIATQPAYAQSNTQTNNGGASAELRLRVNDADDVGGTAVAGGNAIARSGDGSFAALDVRQTMNGDADALADAVGRLLGDPALRARLGEAGRRLLLERYSGARLAAVLEAQYTRLARA